MDLKLEYSDGVDLDKTGIIQVGEHAAIAITPQLGEDYFLFRVQLNESGQAILGFPKFGTIGVGFAQEDDWNTNLPYRCSPQKIFNHIKRNKGDEDISDEDCLKAIEMVTAAAHKLRGTDPVKDDLP